MIEILLIIIIILLLYLSFIKREYKDTDISAYITKILNDSGLFIKIGELSGHTKDMNSTLAVNVQSLENRAKDMSVMLTNHAQSLTDQAKNIDNTLNKKVGEMNETLDKKVGELTVQTEDIRNSHKSVEQMLRVPKERAPIGEIGLEIILSDQLPPDMFGIRQKILDGKIPDAYIKSTSGIICIDSKFPLDNYVKMVETKDPEERDAFKIRFIKDVEGHIRKISTDYINPQKGSADFAFAYIPSEGVYYFLINEAYDMLRNYAGKGVHVTSPLVLTFKIELIKTGVLAQKLSEDTAKVRDEIIRLSGQFKELDESWRIFYNTHFNHALVKAEEVDQRYKRLRGEFNKISVFANKQVSAGKPIAKILSIPSQSTLSQDIVTVPHREESNTLLEQFPPSDDKKTTRETRIVGGKLRKVEIVDGEIIKVFDKDGNLLEDRSAK